MCAEHFDDVMSAVSAVILYISRIIRINFFLSKYWIIFKILPTTACQWHCDVKIIFLSNDSPEKRRKYKKL